MPKQNPNAIAVSGKFLNFYRRQRGLSRQLDHDPRDRRDVQPRISTDDLKLPMTITEGGLVGIEPMDGIERPLDTDGAAELLVFAQRLWDAMAEAGYLR